MALVNQAVQRILDDLVERDIERGLQVAAYLDGELVLDAWAGLADATTRRPVDGATLFVSFSCGKGVLATAIHMLADRGQLNYDAPVASYWPEFAAHGKDAITVRHVLTHSAGIPQLPPGTTIDDLLDWDGTCAGIAALAPLWEPGARTGYHARTFGFVLGELVRRIDGRPLNQFVQQDVCRPLGMDGLYFGIPAEVESRLARLEDSPLPEDPPLPPPDSLLPLVFPPNLPPTAALWDQPAVHGACIPSTAGIMSARALARHYAALACGGELDGVRLISAERIRLASALQTEAVDAVLSVAFPKALGYFLGRDWSPMSPRATAFGHPGSGGSIGFADPERRFAFGLTKTRLVTALQGQDAAYLIAKATRAALDLSD